jgi:hypothetical protein
MPSDDGYGAIEARWGFIIPEDYRRMELAGFFDHKSPHYISLSDVEWLRLADISSRGPMGLEIDGLVPFAMEGGGSTWSWMRDQTIDGLTPIAHCPRDDERAEIFAPDFTSALYRLILQDLRGTWLIGDDDIQTPADATLRFRRYVRELEPFFKPHWTARLNELLKRPFQKMDDGYTGVMRGPELRAILAELNFKELGLQFYHYTQDKDDEQALPGHLSGYFRSYRIFASQFTPADIFSREALLALSLSEPLPVVDPLSPRDKFTLTKDSDSAPTPIFFHYFPTTYFDRTRLKPLNLISPATVSVTVPVESTQFFLDYLAAIEPRRAFYIYRDDEFIPVRTFLNTAA